VTGVQTCALPICIGAVLAGVQADAARAAALAWMPAALWGTGGVLVALLARRNARPD